MYLMIRNPGVAPHECFTVFGASLSRFSDNENVIGEFGSGSKHAINLLMRQNIFPVICAGNLKMEFFTKIQTIADRHNQQKFSRVCIKYSGKLPDDSTKNNTEETGSMLEYGVKDWDEIAMAMREFISNAIDMSIKETGSHSAVEMEVVDKVRAKGGYTSVFIEATQEVVRYVQELPKRFLHFAKLNDQKFLDKLPNLTENCKGAMVYKKGVFVRELKNDRPSIFDYNFGSELQLDESRNVNDYTVKAIIDRNLCNLPQEKIALLLEKVSGDEKLLESSIDPYYFKYNLNDKTKKVWAETFKKFFGENTVITASGDMSRIPEMLERKGLKYVQFPSCWYSVLKDCGILHDHKVIAESEIKHKEIITPTSCVQSTLDEIYSMLEELGLTKGKDKPPIFVFKSSTDAESKCFGQYYPTEKKIGINHDISQGKSNQLFMVVLEEVVHHITGSGDNTRDFQNFLMQIICGLYHQGDEEIRDAQNYDDFGNYIGPVVEEIEDFAAIG